MKILIVEDDLHIGNLLEELLNDQYIVYRAYSGTEALLSVEKNRPDLVILDLMLPGMNGEDVLLKIKGQTKVIVLSAKSSKQDKISNLLNGANDYITKPFDNDELLTRVEVQLRDLSNEDQVMTASEITLNKEQREVFVNGNQLNLTKSEFDILNLLMSRPNQVFSKSLIFESIWDYDALGNEDSVKVHVSNVRSKIKKYSEHQYIETVWGIGFKFNNK